MTELYHSLCALYPCDSMRAINCSCIRFPVVHRKIWNINSRVLLLLLFVSSNPYSVCPWRPCGYESSKKIIHRLKTYDQRIEIINQRSETNLLSRDKLLEIGDVKRGLEVDLEPEVYISYNLLNVLWPHTKFSISSCVCTTSIDSTMKQRNQNICIVWLLYSIINIIVPVLLHLCLVVVRLL